MSMKLATRDVLITSDIEAQKGTISPSLSPLSLSLRVCAAISQTYCHAILPAGNSHINKY